MDMVRQQLQQVAAGRVDELSEAEVKNLTKRKLAAVRTWTAFRLGRGPQFALERVKQHTDLTTEMLRECAPELAASLLRARPTAQLPLAPQTQLCAVHTCSRSTRQLHQLERPRLQITQF